MAATDERVDKLETRVGNLEQQVSAVTAKVDTFISEMRDRDNQRVAEIKALDAKFDALTKQIHDNFIQTMIGVGGMIVALGALIITALK